MLTVSDRIQILPKRLIKTQEQRYIHLIISLANTANIHQIFLLANTAFVRVRRARSFVIDRNRLPGNP